MAPSRALGVVLLAACLTGSVGCATSRRRAVIDPYWTGREHRQSTLERGAMIRVAVRLEPALSGTFQVGRDGTIALPPPCGRVGCAGRTAAEVSTSLGRCLVEAGYLVDPKVTLVVERYSSRPVTIKGQVNRPGAHPWRPGTNLLAALSMAGGLSDATSARIAIERTDAEGTTRRLAFTASDLATGLVPEVMLRPGDVITVSEGR